MTEETKSRIEYPVEWLEVESLDIEAQGIAHKPDGKVVFIEGALPFEVVTANINRKKPTFEKATLTAIHRESSQRVKPGCPHFGLHEGACGGCKMQHLHVGAQVAVKQRVLEDNLWHLGKVKPENILRPIEGPAWGYRYRARLSVRHVHKKGTVLVGFHERKSRYVADMKECHVLPPHVSAMLVPIRGLIASMDAIETLPQIELAIGDMGGNDVIALVLRHLEPLSAGDLVKLREFARQQAGTQEGKKFVVQWWLQAKGPETVKLLDEALTDIGHTPQLAYALPEFGITMPFKPTDFTQVNPHINRVLVSRALRLLDAQRDERVIDWFCGLGNFTLPIATQAGDVLGVEGSEALVERSRQNYKLNQASALANHALAATKFVARNLFEMTPELLMQDGTADKWLVDPPREGAFSLVKALADLHRGHVGSEVMDGAVPGSAELAPRPLERGHWTPPKRIVYVSCNPATLARDAGLLVHEAGYRCVAAGVINMFPHTAHVESMAVFERVVVA
ncbi:MAG: hypothetical protein RIS34_1539 [Pseudomonadota bacterium]|jgi:23S rRNA (uracil1939-C5)-methyltransferase